MFFYDMLKQLKIKTTKKQEIIDITDTIKKIISESKIKNGICLVYVSHTTAGIIINEDYDKNLCDDILNRLEELIPKTDNYKHNCIDNNAHAHIKAAIMGPSETIIIRNAQLSLGTWQGIALTEFDGPRERNIFIKIIEDKNGI